MHRIDMTRRVICLVRLFVIGLFLGFSALQSAAAADPPQHAVISRGEAAGPYQAFPDVCRLPSGDLACVFYAGYGHVSLPNAEWPRGGRVCLVQSSDEGRTWSPPRVLFDGPQDDRDPAHRRPARRHVGVQFLSVSVGRRQDRARRLPGRIARRRPNVGRPSRACWPTNRWAVSAPVRELPDGTRLLGVYTGDDSTAYGAVLRSTDGGKTWSEPVAIDPKSGVRLDAETDVLRLPDGTILAALRGDGKVNLHFATSSDQGLTWSKVKDSGFLGHSPHLTRLSTGEILLTHRQPATAMHISRDNAKSWQGPIEIDSVGGAYPVDRGTEGPHRARGVLRRRGDQRHPRRPVPRYPRRHRAVRLEVSWT